MPQIAQTRKFHKRHVFSPVHSINRKKVLAIARKPNEHSFPSICYKQSKQLYVNTNLQKIHKRGDSNEYTQYTILNIN